MYEQVKNSVATVKDTLEQIPLPANALAKVTAKSGMGVYASSDTLYKGAIFGRDSLEVAEDLLTVKPRLVKKIILGLTALQGTTFNEITEEEPGRIVHEYRSLITDGKKIKSAQLDIFNTLSEKWGGNGNYMAYYGSVDATPHFVRVVAAWCDLYGTQLLHSPVQHVNGHQTSVLEATEQAVEWIERRIAASAHGLVSFLRTNPDGIANQVWKDSDEFYMHESGESANHTLPISSIEVQGLAYDALLGAVRLFPERTKRLKSLAEQLRHSTIEHLWLADRQEFALGTDYDSHGTLRIIKTASANQGALLDTHIFDDLPEQYRQLYVTSIVRAMMGPDFLTDAGVRSRSLACARLVPFWDYHGSFVSWTKETYDIAKGLRRQGFPLLARQLENRILNVCLRYKAYPEFVYVDGTGRVFAGKPKQAPHKFAMHLQATNTPEQIQAWTVSAVIGIIDYRTRQKLRLKKETADQQAWQKEFEAKMLAQIPSVHRHINPLALRARYPRYHYMVDRKQ